MSINALQVLEKGADDAAVTAASTRKWPGMHADVFDEKGVKWWSAPAVPPSLARLHPGLVELTVRERDICTLRKLELPEKSLRALELGLACGSTATSGKTQSSSAWFA